MVLHLTKELSEALHKSGDMLPVRDPGSDRMYVIIDMESPLAAQILREREDAERLEQGLSEARAGQTMLFEDADQQIREQLGFPPRQ